MKHGIVRADGVDVFYREAGRSDAPALLLLHGFANSSFYFRHLMPKLSDRFRTIAPDIPSFGFTEIPAARSYAYTFESLSTTIAAFVDAIGLDRFAMYVFDYGAPIGFNLALKDPARIAGIVSQSGNVYKEGLGEKAWAPLYAYWAHPSEAKREPIKERMTFEGVKSAYFAGVKDPSVIEPECYTLDAAILARPGNADLQVSLKLDYDSNIARYPLYQQYLREYRPPLVAIWGKHDSFFTPPGAEAFKRDVPDASVSFVDGAHFALETNLDEIAAAIAGLKLDA